MEICNEKKVICIFCESILEDNWNYCPYCKKNQEKVKCFHCKKEISGHWKYCPHCKGKLNKEESDIINSANDWLKDMFKN